MKKQIEQRLSEIGYKLGNYDNQIDSLLTDKEALDKVLNNLNSGSIDLFIRVNDKLYIINIVHIENEEREVDIYLENNEEYFSVAGTLDTALDYGNITQEEYNYYKNLNKGENKMILKNLEELIDREFDYDEVICCFEGEEEVIVNEVEGYISNFEGFGMCQLYNAYYNTEEDAVYSIWVNSDDIVVAVGTCNE